MTFGDEELLVTSRFRVLRHTRTGRDGKPNVRESVQHPGSVAILPVLEDGRVCLIRNQRVAVGQLLVEMPAGTLEPGEDPAACAARELIEETGFRAGQIRKLLQFFVSPGILNERMHLFLATQLVAGAPQLEAGEDIQNLIVPWAEAMQMVDDGTIQDVKTLAGLLCYDRMLRSS